MKRLLRIFFEAAGVLSAVLALGMAGIWVRSYWTAQYVGRTELSGWRGGLSMAGLLRFEHGTFAMDKPGWSYSSDPLKSRDGLWGEVAARDRTGGWFKRLGIAYAQTDYGSDGRRMRYAVYMPHWLLVAAFSFPAFAWTLTILRRRRAARRIESNRCVACGYDLRATPKRCPECGSVPRVAV